MNRFLNTTSTLVRGLVRTVITPIMLTGDNYESWSRSLRNNLRAKNKLGFIDGTITVPASTSPDFPQWGIVNSMLVAWIFNSLDVSVRSTMRFPDNVKTLWDDLRDRYSLGNGPRILELKNKLRDCRQNGRPMAVFFGELRQLQDELLSSCPLPVCTCSDAAAYSRLQETELLHQFFLGLDAKKFGTLVSGLLMQDPLPSLNVAYAKIISDERKQLVFEANDTRSDAVGFSVVSRPSPPVGGDETRLCSHCGRTGHVKDRCFQFHGFPDRHGGHGRGPRGGRGSSRGAATFAATAAGGSRTNLGPVEVNTGDRCTAPTLTDEQWQQLMAHLKGSTSLTTEKLSGMSGSDYWLFDSGAYNHMSGNLSLFTNLRNITSSVGLPNGHSTIATKEGTIFLSDGLILEHVLYVPALTYNLLFVSQLLATNSFVVFFTNKLCIIQDLTLKNLIGAGVQFNGVYVFQPVRAHCFQAHKVAKVDNASLLRHRRLGHPSLKVLSLLPSLVGTSFSLCDLDCPICFMGKQPRNSFPLSSNKASDIFDLVHCDIWGPNKIPSTCNARYFLTIVDDFTRVTWVYLMSHKSEVGQLVQNFYSMVKTQFNRKIKVFRSDNGL